MKNLKKVLVLCVAVVMMCAIAGCSEEEAKEDVQKFEGTIEKDWTAVEDEFKTLEGEAADEINSLEEVSKEDIDALVKTVKDDTAKLENGISEETEDVAKELYAAAHKLEVLGEKGVDAVEHDVVTLGADAKALVKHYYGVAEEDFDTVKARVEEKLQKIEEFGENEWNEFLGLFK